jgi:hypothetical protein
MKKLITLALALLGGLGGCGYSDPADWLTATMRTDQEVCDQTGRCKNGTKPTVRTYRPTWSPPLTVKPRRYCSMR